MSYEIPTFIKYTYESKIAESRINKIQSMLRQRPHSVYEIADAICVGKDSALKYIKHLIAAEQVYVREYRPHDFGRGYVRQTRLYAWGSGVDATKPNPKPKYVAKPKAIKVKTVAQVKTPKPLADRKVRQPRVKKDKPKRIASPTPPAFRDPLVAMLFGGSK